MILYYELSSVQCRISCPKADFHSLDPTMRQSDTFCEIIRDGDPFTKSRKYPPYLFIGVGNAKFTLRIQAPKHRPFLRSFCGVASRTVRVNGF